MRRAARKRIHYDDVVDTLRRFWRIPEEYLEQGGVVSVPGSETRPSIYYDPYRRLLILGFPDPARVYPPRDSDILTFYRELAEAIEKPEDVEKLEAYLSRHEINSIKRACGRDVDCIIDMAWKLLEDKMEEQAMRTLCYGESWTTTVCGIPVTVKRDVVPIPVSDGFVEWNEYIAQDNYVIDLEQVPDTDTLECVIRGILGERRRSR